MRGHMDPAIWRKKRGLTLKETARQIGHVSESMVFRYERGQREAPTSVSLAYERISGGAVTAADLNRTRKRFLRTTQDPKRAA